MKKSDKKGKKKQKLVQSARDLAEEIAFQNTVHANLDYGLEHHTICRIRFRQDGWTATHRWWVLGLSRDYVYAARVNGFLLDGYEIVPISAIAEVVPLVHYTDQCNMLDIHFPQAYPDLDLDTLPQLFTGLARLDCCVRVGHEDAEEEDSHAVVGRIEKVGKKRLTIRGLDLSDVSWQAKPDKFVYEEINRIQFGTRLVAGYEHLAMSYEAFIRSVNETVRPPEELDDFEGGEDVREEQSEDFVDIDELDAVREALEEASESGLIGDLDED